MLQLVILAGAVALTVSETYIPNPELDGKWQTFKQSYNKVYSPGEEPQRRRTFEENLSFISKHNEQADQGHKSYWMGVNQFADMSWKEFVSMLKTSNSSKQPTQSSGKPYVSSGSETSSRHRDWRKDGIVSGVKNQGRTLRCWSLSVVGAVESHVALRRNRLTELSRQQVIDCSHSTSCHAGSRREAFDYVVSYGLMTARDYPFEKKDGDCRFRSWMVAARCAGLVHIKQGHEPSLMTAVDTFGPVSVGINVQPTFQFADLGIYKEPNCNSYDLNHDVLLIGYGTEGNDDYWLIQNSWGIYWGNLGYLKMARNLRNQCGIATDAMFPYITGPIASSSTVGTSFLLVHLGIVSAVIGSVY